MSYISKNLARQEYREKKIELSFVDQGELAELLEINGRLVMPMIKFIQDIEGGSAQRECGACGEQLHEFPQLWVVMGCKSVDESALTGVCPRCEKRNRRKLARTMMRYYASAIEEHPLLAHRVVMGSA